MQTATNSVEKFWEGFANLPKAENFENWTMEVIIASFPKCEIAEVYAGSLQYIGWLNSLPTTTN